MSTTVSVCTHALSFKVDVAHSLKGCHYRWSSVVLPRPSESSLTRVSNLCRVHTKHTQFYVWHFHNFGCKLVMSSGICSNKILSKNIPVFLDARTVSGCAKSGQWGCSKILMLSGAIMNFVDVRWIVLGRSLITFSPFLHGHRDTGCPWTQNCLQTCVFTQSTEDAVVYMPGL